MLVWTSPCHHCSAEHKLLLLKTKTKELSKWVWKSSRPEILVIRGFDLLQFPCGVPLWLLTIGIFYLLCSSLKNSYLETLPFKSMPWLSILLSLLLLFKKRPCFTTVCAPQYVTGTNQPWAVLGWGAHQQSWPVVCAWRGRGPSAELVSTVREVLYLASVLDDFKKFCIWRMEMLIYLLKILLCYLKVIW